MNPTPAFRGLSCEDCGRSLDPDAFAHRCPDCDGLLTATYDYDAVDAERLRAGGASGGDDTYGDLLPIQRTAATALGAGGTALVECPSLADELEVGSVRVKDEGRNPTGAVTDRGFGVAVAAAAQSGADAVALPTTGNGGQSAAAYAGRAGLDSESFVPSRCPFVNKAMVNVHGGEMSVVEGRYGDALAAYRERADAGHAPVGPASPYRREGAKTLYLEVVADRGWSAPDALVVPVGHGVVLAGVQTAVEALAALGLVTETPRLYAVQPAECAPVVEAWDADRAVEPVETPDTIVGPLEVADPAAGPIVLDALAATGGGAVGVPDDDVLAAAAEAASETGVEVGATGGVAVAGARALAADGELGPDEDVVLVNPVAGSKEGDLLRSYLMSQGT